MPNNSVPKVIGPEAKLPLLKRFVINSYFIFSVFLRKYAMSSLSLRKIHVTMEALEDLPQKKYIKECPLLKFLFVIEMIVFFL